MRNRYVNIVYFQPDVNFLVEFFTGVLNWLFREDAFLIQYNLVTQIMYTDVTAMNCFQ